MSTTTNLIGHNRTVYLAIANGATETGLTTAEVSTLTGIGHKTVACCFTILRRRGKIAPCVWRLSEGGSQMHVWAYNLPERITNPPENAPGMDAPAQGRWRQVHAPAKDAQNGSHGPAEAAPAESATPEPSEPPAPLSASSGAILAAAPRSRMLETEALERRMFEQPEDRGIGTDAAVLISICTWPGRAARDLPGLVASDATRLLRLEEAGLITFQSGGWHLTGKGDIFLLENA